MTERRLSPHCHEALQRLCNTTSFISDSAKSVCDSLMDVLLKSGHNFDETTCSKEMANDVWTVLVDSARIHLSAEAFAEQVSRLCGSEREHPLIDSLVDTYKVGCPVAKNDTTIGELQEQGEALREAMQSIGWEYPKVIGVNWSILSVVESNDKNVEIEEPLAEINFKTLATGQTIPSDFSFLCNKNQLLDFQWKVKEAANFLHSMADQTKREGESKGKRKRQ